MVKIHRIWFNTERMDREDHYKITLFSRPRVSIHVDEYIWSFIEENIVKPHKLMRSEKHEYLLDIAFGQFDPAKHRYFPLSSYNGLLREGVEMDSANRSYFREDFAGGKDRTTWFSPNKIWTNCGDKVLNVDIKAANVSENITPREYADLLQGSECGHQSCQCEREYYPQRIRRFAFRWNWSGLSVQFQKAQARGV